MSITEVGYEAAGVEAAPVQAIQGRSPWRLAWARLRTDKVAIASGIVIIVFCLVALAAPAIAAAIGHPPAYQYPNGTTALGMPKPPGGTFWLGTDNLGRDLLVRLVYGARVSLEVSFAAIAIAVVTGVLIGMVAGYYGGVVDMLLARFTDSVLAFPYLVLALALAAAFGPGLPMIIGVIAFFSWAQMARIVRGQTLSIKEKEYIEAARAVGASPLRIMFLDIFPNLLAQVLVIATLLIPVAIVFEATLSFLGAGLQPPTASWGNMIADSQNFYQVAWWFLFFPSGALFIITLAFNLLGDGIRDAIDPRTERIFAARRKRRAPAVNPAPLPPGGSAEQGA